MGALLVPSRRRYKPVRLTDLEPTVRLRAARAVCKHEPDPMERAKVISAALSPSDRIYWIAA